MMIHADSEENVLGYSSLYIERQVLVYTSHRLSTSKKELIN